MKLSETEVKRNPDKDPDPASEPETDTTRNDQETDKFIAPEKDKLAILEKLVGILPNNMVIDEEALREERLSRQ